MIRRASGSTVAASGEPSLSETIEPSSKYTSTRSLRLANRRRKAIVPASEPRKSAVPVSTLRRAIRLLLLRALRARLRLPLVTERAQAALQVVEDQTDGGLRCGGRSDRALAVPDEEHAALTRRDLRLDRLPACGAADRCE